MTIKLSSFMHFVENLKIATEIPERNAKVHKISKIQHSVQYLIDKTTFDLSTLVPFYKLHL